MGKISILIPVYNEVKYIEKCILEVKKYCEGKYIDQRSKRIFSLG